MNVKMKSLNNLSPEYLKKFVSDHFDVNIKNIRLFGSRINGDYGEYSDLDVAIIGKCPVEKEGVGLYINGLDIEIHWFEDFDHSWLVNSI